MANSGSLTPQQQQNSASGLLQQLLGANAPALAEGQLQYNLGNEQLGLAGANVANTQNYNNAMAANQMAGTQISGQQIGLSQLANTQQQQQAGVQQGIEQQEYGLQSGQYPEQQAEAQLAYQNALMQTQGAQAIGGTQNTVGGKSAISTLGAQYGFQQEDIARAQGLSQLGQQSEQSGYGFSQEQLQNASQNLALNAQANGLSQQQILTMLNYGNQQTGTQGLQNVISLLANQGSAALGNLQNAGAAISPIGFASGFNALAGVGAP